VSRLIRERGLPCTVALVDFLDFRPARRFHGAVFMGSLEHFDHPRAVAAFLARYLEPGARVWADFCTASGGRRVGPFLARHVFPGPAAYVDVPALQDALERQGFALRELVDDTESYGLSCRDWADALDREGKALAERFDEETVRVFRVFLRASQHFFETGRTRAMHLVAQRAHGLPPVGSDASSHPTGGGPVARV
jgi:cyclopropane fatty-acyl-phospholipid synthase-like methyltransferase